MLIKTDDDAESALPSILFIVVDDLGSNDVSAWAKMQANDPQISTPNLDQLISEGVSLRSYYTLPVCSPTRTSILSGRYPMHIGTQHQVLWAGQRAGLPLEDKTIADRLSARGYTCQAIGKWHTGFYSWEHTPTFRGFAFSWFLRRR